MLLLWLVCCVIDVRIVGVVVWLLMCMFMLVMCVLLCWLVGVVVSVC